MNTLDGGPDRFGFLQRANSGVTANLATGTANGPAADTLISIENVEGSRLVDNITGDPTNNGHQGNDSLDGGPGTDQLKGAPGPTHASTEEQSRVASPKRSTERPLTSRSPRDCLSVPVKGSTPAPLSSRWGDVNAEESVGPSGSPCDMRRTRGRGPEAPSGLTIPPGWNPRTRRSIKSLRSTRGIELVSMYRPRPPSTPAVPFTDCRLRAREETTAFPPPGVADNFQYDVVAQRRETPVGAGLVAGVVAAATERQPAAR